jgi:hypothetical protein
MFYSADTQRHIPLRSTTNHYATLCRHNTIKHPHPPTHTHHNDVVTINDATISPLIPLSKTTRVVSIRDCLIVPSLLCVLLLWTNLLLSWLVGNQSWPSNRLCSTLWAGTFRALHVPCLLCLGLLRGRLARQCFTHGGGSSPKGCGGSSRQCRASYRRRSRASCCLGSPAMSGCSLRCLPTTACRHMTT